MNRVLLMTFIFFYTAIYPHPEDRFEKIDQLLLQYRQPHAPGLSIGVVENGKLIYAKGIGFSSVENKILNTPHTIFNVASLAKQFTAACVWILVEKKQISLEDNIRVYLPEIPDYGATIKIKHLLNHTSGIHNYHVVMELQGFDYNKEYYTNESVLKLASRQKSLTNLPGEKVLYSNTNYTLLTILIERVSKKGLNEFARENIFAPLQMNSSYFKISAEQEVQAGELASKAKGYQMVEGKYRTNPVLQESYGAGNMCSSIDDLAKWMTVLNGTNLKFKSLTSFLTTCEKLSGGERAKYARGVMIDRYKGTPTISHSGYEWGGQAQLITLPKKKLGVIILTNVESINPGPVSYQVLNLFLDTTRMQTFSRSHKKLSGHIPTAKYKRSAKQMQFYTGHYKEINSDMKMDIFVENDTLKAKGGMAKKSAALLESGTNKFRRINSENVEYDFTGNADHDMVVSFSGTPFYFKKAQFISPESVSMDEFVGEFYSDELQTFYRFYKEGNSLYLSYTNHIRIPLSPVQKDAFGNNQRTLYQFSRDSQNRIKSMVLSSEGTVKNILFLKR